MWKDTKFTVRFDVKMMMTMQNKKDNISRRTFLKMMGAGSAAAAIAACAGKKSTDADDDDYKNQLEPPVGKMTYRTCPTSGDRVSL